MTETKPRAMRTKDVDWPERKHEAKTERHCVLCDRDIKPGSTAREVLLVGGANRAVHRDDWDLADEDEPGFLGVHLIGPACARRRVGMTYSRPESREQVPDVECVSCGVSFVSGEAPAWLDVVVCRKCFAKPGVGPMGVVA